jgi:hypothetical protein
VARKPKRDTAKAKPPAGLRISIDAALQRLLRVCSPHAAAERLNIALRANTVRLWCNGTLQPPSFIRTEIVAQARIEADGRARAEVVPARGAWEDKPYRWEVDPAEVAALLPATRNKPGPKPTGDWHVELARFLIAKARDNPDALDNIEQLVRDAREALEDSIQWAPTEDREIRRMIQRMLPPRTR